MSIRVSIAMATYNGEKYLQEQLDSFVNQTRQPDELVVCDDDSTDRTLDILENFARSAPFEVRVLRNETNLGYVKNFEKAVSLCSGDIVVLSDQDDVWFSDKISVLCGILISRPDVKLVRSDMLLADEKMNSSGISQVENMLSLGSKTSDFNFGCGMAFRKELLNVALPIPTCLWGHDRWMGKLAYAVGVSFLIQQPLMYYRRHSVNASTSLASETRALTIIDAFKAYGLKDARNGWSEEMMRLQDIEKRLIEKETVLQQMVDKEDLSRRIGMLRDQKKNLSKRIDLASKSRVVRFVFVARLWINGGYRQFSGWKSALKDLIRP